MTNTVAGIHLGIDTHANRPAATAVSAGSLYSCSDHDLIYRSDGSTWSTWATLSGGSSPIAANSFRATRITSAQSISAATYTKVEFNNEVWDTGGDYDPTTNYRYTAAETGYYLFTGVAFFTGLNADARRIVRVDKNGSEYQRVVDEDNSAVDTYHPWSCLVDLSATNYVEVSFWGEDAFSAGIGSVFSGLRVE